MNNMNNNMNNNMDYMINMNNMGNSNNFPQIINDLSTRFMGLNINQQNNINKAFNSFSQQNLLNGSTNNLSLSQVDLNQEITMIFRFMSGQLEKVKGKYNEIFLDVFNRFHEEQCPEYLKNYACVAMNQSKLVDNNKTLFENNIKEGDYLLFIKENPDNKETKKDEEEEEDEDSLDNEDEDKEERDKLIKEWIEEYRYKKFSELIAKLMLSNDNNENEEENNFDIKIDLKSDDFLKFINDKMLGIKTEEHEHKLIYLKTNFDWKCNKCKSSRPKKEPRLYCSICDFNMCNKCRKEKEYGKNIGNIPINEEPTNKSIKKQFINTKGHKHRLTYCRTKRSRGHESWLCDKCKAEHPGKDWTFYCTCCDFDLCDKCAKNENLL